MARLPRVSKNGSSYEPRTYYSPNSCDRQYYVPLLILHLHARSLALDTRPLLNSSGSATGRVEIIIGRVMLHEGLLELIEMAVPAVSFRRTPNTTRYSAAYFSSHPYN